MRPVSPVARSDLTDYPGRVFAVGDLHGMAHALERLLELAGFDAGRDLLWSLGDLVDRGPFCARCLALLDEPWFRALRGNHEQLMLDAPASENVWLQWLANGGDWAVDFPWDAPEIRARLDALPWAADLRTAVGRIGLVHADVDWNCDWPELLTALERATGLSRYVALWSRRSAIRAMRGLPGRQVPGVDLVLLGHSIVESSFRWGNLQFLDTGAVACDDPTAALTMLEIHPALQLWSVPTAGDPAASLWRSGLNARRSAAVLGQSGRRRPPP